jgi:hypothetical protein
MNYILILDGLSREASLTPCVRQLHGRCGFLHLIGELLHKRTTAVVEHLDLLL